ncbi:MAG: TIGR00730 family Rossman fold protein [Proteobacteria bacterium]|nr:TIGR00730 family Rossman fold protein [Pseudomonadota bacterium]
MTKIRSICVFCGASTGHDPRYREHTQLLGKLIAEAGMILVYGGGKDGLMGVLADSALAAGGAVIGVIPEFLKDREHGHTGVTDLQIVDSMHSRKQRMFDLSDAFVVLPGGVGTLDETLEMITWKQLGRHDKPIVIADIDGYWQTLDALIATTIEHGFAAPATRALYVLAPTIESAIDTLRKEPPGKIHTDTGQL